MDLFPIMLGTISEIQKAVLDKALTIAYEKKGITNDSKTWKREPPKVALSLYLNHCRFISVAAVFYSN